MKVLVRLPNWLGDMVMSIAFINALKEVYPVCEIGVIVKREFRGVLDYCNNIKHVIEYSKQDFNRLSYAFRYMCRCWFYRDL